MCRNRKRKRNRHKSYAQENKILDRSKTCSSSGCIRSKDGTIITEKEDILERWTDYIEELFRDNRGGKPEVGKNIDGPKILQSKIRAALSRMKGNKARGPDWIVIETSKALDDFGIEKLTIMANEIYDTGKIPQDLSKSIFIALPKKPGTIECELHRTIISLMSHITKVILRVIMIRVRRCTKPEISQEQCEFVEDTGTRNAIFIVRTLCKWSMKKHLQLYTNKKRSSTGMCFLSRLIQPLQWKQPSWPKRHQELYSGRLQPEQCKIRRWCSVDCWLRKSTPRTVEHRCRCQPA